MLRSLDTELMDAAEATDEELEENYRELQRVHRWLGNTGTVLRLLRGEVREQGPVRRVLDIGCGQGALLAEIHEKLGLEVIGFDLRPAPSDAPVPILTGNAAIDPLPKADVAICVVVAHHLLEAELGAMIRNVARSCDRFIVLDLVRHPLPLALFRAFVAPLLGQINASDGQTSIRRAYTAAEMRKVVDDSLSGCQRTVRWMRHTVSPFWIRQVVDISWEPVAIA